MKIHVIWKTPREAIGNLYLYLSYERKIYRRKKEISSFRRNKNRRIIYIPKTQIEKLYFLVKKDLLIEYKYKFPLAP